MDLMRVGWSHSVRVVVLLVCAGFVSGSVVVAAFHARDTASGEEVYAAQKCASCHSVGGKGNQKYPLDGVGSRLNEAEIREWLVNPDTQQAKKGTRPLMRMPSYRSLSAEDLGALVTYVKAL
jgi:mono/diheme cytochrome c family protein